jgi:glycosyltransferase involved in cell wall biosynthesis
VDCPLVTALIDTYNQGRFIEEAIESVLAQDYPRERMEILVVDDGSTDDTTERVKRFGARIRYIRKANGGQASALNLGFSESRGEIIALLDGDDTWHAHKLTAITRTLETNPNAVLAYHPMAFFNATTRQTLTNNTFFPVSGRILSSMESALRYGSVSTSNMALQRKVVERLSPIPEGMRIYADSYLAYLAVFLGPVVAVNEPLTRYRIHGDNLASCTSAPPDALLRRSRSFRESIDAIRRWLEQNGFDAKEANAAAFLRRQELVAQMLEFTATPPGRMEFSRYLTAFNRLYAPLWKTRYRMFRAVMPTLAMVTGYSGFEALQRIYAAGFAIRARERWVAAQAAESLVALPERALPGASQ